MLSMLDPRPTQTPQKPQIIQYVRCTSSYSWRKRISMLILVTGLTPTFGSPGEYMLDSTFEMG